MRAAVRDRYGPPDVVQIREVEQPTPTGDEVLVRVHAASVNRADLDGLYPRWQFIRLFLGLRRPRYHGLGLDMAGVVEAAGPAARSLRRGDRVFADLFPYMRTGQGAFADFVCIPERAFLPIPEGLGFDEAACLPHSAVLAVQGLRLGHRAVGGGDRVLVVGASGNVGPFVVQIAKARGAHVTGVCRGDKADFVRSLGADSVIDYTTTDYTRTGERYDWIVDVDARHGFLAWPRMLRPKGVYLAMGGPPRWLVQALLVAPLLSVASGKRLGLMLGWKPFEPADVATVTALIAAGQLRPRIDRRFNLEQVVQALQYVDAGSARGKVVIDVAPAE